MFHCVFHCAFFAALHSAVLFFSSSLADVALRLGPYMSISCRKDVCTRTQLVHMSRQIEVEKPKKHTRPPNHDDPQIPQPDLRFARGNSKTTRTTNQTQKKGAGAQTQHPQNRFAKGHSGLTTASASKTCDKNELRTTTFKQT